MKVVILPLILIGVFLNSSAQLLLKAGMNRIGHFEFSLTNFWAVTTQVALNPYIICGLVAYVVSVLVWLLVLSRADVSYAYPLISLGYILSAIIAYYFFGEDLSSSRILGIVVILCGVYLVARS